MAETVVNTCFFLNSVVSEGMLLSCLQCTVYIYTKYNKQSKWIIKLMVVDAMK